MDDLDQREAFLLAIFANPDDDLPRLVFADWLEERGEAAWAQFIRVQCEIARLGHPSRVDYSLREREQRLYFEVDPDADLTILDGGVVGSMQRGFRPSVRINCAAELLADPVRLRRVALVEHPEWYGSGGLCLMHGLIASSKPISTILNSPVMQRVTRLDLSGARVMSQREVSIGEESYGLLDDFEYRPVVTLQAVEALVSARECRRFTHLDLTNNDLDNDAARAILRSNYLTRLESLRLFDGNQLRGRTWGALREKFGEDVVS